MGEELLIGGMPFYFNASDADGNVARRTMSVFAPYADYTNGGVTRNVTFPEVVITPDSKRSPGARAVLERQRRRDYDLQNGFGSYNGLRASESPAIDLARSRREVANSPYVKAANYAADAMSGIGMGADIAAGLPIYSTLRGARELSKGNYLEGSPWLTPYRLLLKSLPYAVPMSAAGYSLAIDGARAYKYLQQSALASNPVRNWLIGQAFKHPNSKIWGKLLNSATNAMTKPRFNSLLNIGKKQQLVADGIGVGFDGFQAIDQTNQGNYMSGAMNVAQGGIGVLGMLGTLGKLPSIYNNTMNLVRPASNGYEVVDDASKLTKLVR